MRSFVAILAALAVGAAVWLSGRGSSAPPPEPTASSAAQATATDPDAAAARSNTPAAALLPAAGPADRVAATPPPGGLFGLALDHRGEPLAGVRVRAVCDEVDERRSERTRTWADGRFAFDGLTGTWTCAICGSVEASLQVRIAAGARRDIVLRLDEPAVLLTGVVRTGSRAVHDRVVRIRGRDAGGATEQEDHTDHDGRFVHLLRPGSYALLVAGPPTSIAWPMAGATIWAEVATEAMQHANLELSALAPRVHRDVLLPPGRAIVGVHAPDGRPIDQAAVTLASADHPDRTWTRLTDASGEITFEELPPGNWRATAAHELHRPRTDATFSIEGDERAREVALTLEPAGALVVQLVTQNGDPVEPMANDRLQLLVAGAVAQAGRRTPPTVGLPTATRFDSVPAGRHELRCSDERLPDGRLRFAPVEPFVRTGIAIEAGEVTELQVPVRPRARLRIDLRGQGQALATIAVRSSRGEVAPSHAGYDHWSAEVPPDDYRVEIRCGAHTQIEHLAVAHEDVQHVLRLR